MYFLESSGADLLKEAIAVRILESAGASADELSKLVATSARHQIYMVKAESGEPLGYIAAAKISKYTLNLLLNDPAYQLRPYELEEGKILYIVDAFFRKNRFKKSFPVLMDLLKRYRLVCFSKNGQLKLYYNNKFGARSVSGGYNKNLVQNNHSRYKQ